jgi:calcium-dependent protein kinase
MDHPNIIKIFEFFQDKKHFHIVTELCEGGELFDYIMEQGQITEKIASEIMKQVLSAMVFCHEMNIVHRDLKPENLLLEFKPSSKQPIVIKVIDFGTSSLYSPNKKLTAKFGTPYYVAPEVLREQYNEK